MSFYCLIFTAYPYTPVGAQADRSAFRRAVLHGPKPTFKGADVDDSLVRLCRMMLSREAFSRPNAAKSLAQLKASPLLMKDAETSESASATTCGASFTEDLSARDETVSV